MGFEDNVLSETSETAGTKETAVAVLLLSSFTLKTDLRQQPSAKVTQALQLYCSHHPQVVTAMEPLKPLVFDFYHAEPSQLQYCCQEWCKPENETFSSVISMVSRAVPAFSGKTVTQRNP